MLRKIYEEHNFQIIAFIALFEGQFWTYKQVLLLNFLNIEYTHDVYRRLCVIKELNTKRHTLFLFFGSHETSPIIWIGKPAPAMQCYLIVERDRKEQKNVVVAMLGGL